jgi:hypothetical protein
MYVVFDSNIWISELGLNSPKGSAARFFIKSQNAIVILPEVIKLETERHLRFHLRTYVANLKKNYDDLLTIFGKLKEIVLPSEDEIDAKVSEVFRNCKVELHEVPFTIESARSSFLKTIDKLPPSDKDQQFKDGVIWADCMRLLETDDVYLITEDKAFYKGRDHKKGIMAPSLSEEAEAYPNNIYLFSSITQLLPSIKTEVRIDEDSLVAQFTEGNKQSIDDILLRHGFAVVRDPVVNTDIYATEDPNRLYIEFEILYSCEDLRDDNRLDAQLILKGDCFYVPVDQKFEKLRNYGEEILYKTSDGEKSIGNVVIFADSLVIGHKSIDHSVRYKLVDHSVRYQFDRND